jgi:hypothetical protein
MRVSTVCTRSSKVVDDGAGMRVGVHGCEGRNPRVLRPPKGALPAHHPLVDIGKGWKKAILLTGGVAYNLTSAVDHLMYPKKWESQKPPGTLTDLISYCPLFPLHEKQALKNK